MQWQVTPYKKLFLVMVNLSHPSEVVFLSRENGSGLDSTPGESQALFVKRTVCGWIIALSHHGQQHIMKNQVNEWTAHM